MPFDVPMPFSPGMPQMPPPPQPQQDPMIAELLKLGLDPNMIAQLLQEAKRLRGRDLVDAIDRIASLEAILAKQDTRLRQGGIALKMWYVEFGLTPSARTRVRVGPEPKATDPAKQRFLQGLNLA